MRERGKGVLWEETGAAQFQNVKHICKSIQQHDFRFSQEEKKKPQLPQSRVPQSPIFGCGRSVIDFGFAYIALVLGNHIFLSFLPSNVVVLRVLVVQEILASK